jgi:hypothetical protein
VLICPPMLCQWIRLERGSTGNRILKRAALQLLAATRVRIRRCLGRVRYSTRRVLLYLHCAHATHRLTAVCIKIGTCEPRSVVSRHVTLVETLARGSSLVVGHLGMQCWFCSACSSLYYATQSAHSKAIYTLYALVRTCTTRSRRPPEPPCTPAVPVPMIRGVAKMGRHLYVSAKRCIYHSSVC